VVVGNNEQQIKEMLAALNMEGKSLTREQPSLPQLSRRGEWTSIADENQGALTSLAADYLYAQRNTFWDRSRTYSLTGPLSPQEWQFVKARMVAGPFYQFRIMIDPDTNQNSLYLFPAPPAGLPLYFEYVSKNWVASSDLTQTYDSFGTSDNDVGLVDETLLQLGVEWRWLRTKGFDSWKERKRDYDMYKGTVKAQDGGSTLFFAGGGSPNTDINILVPEGNWESS
jgi:cell wall-associated NlpC family hydrolase